MRHAFVANMTGNTVLLGISIFQPGAEHLAPLISLLFYVVGAAVGSILTRKVTPGPVWVRAVSAALILEAVLMFAAAAGWVAYGGAPGLFESRVLLSMVATSMGLQSGALLPLGVPGVVTTYITGTWTTFVRGVVLTAIEPGQTRQEPDFAQRTVVQMGVLSIYFVSAVAAGAAFEFFPVISGPMAAAPVLFVAIYGAVRG